MLSISNIITTIFAMLSSLLVAWLAIMKFKKDLKTESDRKDILGIKDFYGANAEFRKELRADFERIRVEYDKSKEEVRNLEIRIRDLEKESIECSRRVAELKFENSALLNKMKMMKSN